MRDYAHQDFFKDLKYSNLRFKGNDLPYCKKKRDFVAEHVRGWLVENVILRSVKQDLWGDLEAANVHRVKSCAFLGCVLLKCVGEGCAVCFVFVFLLLGTSASVQPSG